MICLKSIILELILELIQQELPLQVVQVLQLAQALHGLLEDVVLVDDAHAFSLPDEPFLCFPDLDAILQIWSLQQPDRRVQG